MVVVACTAPFGSLIVAIVKTLKFLARQAQSSTNNGALKLAMCCVICLIDCIEKFLEWLTEWAYVYCAIYGTSFVESGSKVVKLLARSGIGAIANDVLVEPIISMAAFVGLGTGIGLGYAAALT